MLAGLLLFLATAPPKRIHLEAESGRLFGVTVTSARAGFSGSGYVTGFDKPSNHLELHTNAQPGLYLLKVRYSTPLGAKGFDIAVNGEHFSGLFPATAGKFATADKGRVELTAGDNKIEIDHGWGWFDVDAVDLMRTEPPAAPLSSPADPADPHATSETRALMRRLLKGYGRVIVTGQYEADECRYIRSVTGRTPAILGADFMDYSPSRVQHGARPEGTTEQVIAAARAGQIVTMSWHWNAPADLIDRNYTDARGNKVEAPWYKGFYTYATRFDAAAALADTSSPNYQLLIRDMDTIAKELQKFSAARIPVLWRPLHEAEGGWFWWGANGPETYIKLYRLMFDRFTRVHGLHNLIWVENSIRPEWYPGDKYVDIVAVDAYPQSIADTLSGTWDELYRRFNGRKPLAIAEFGGAPDVDRMVRFGARWLYFVSWTGGLGPRKNTREELKRIYRSPRAVTLTH